ncbi:MAG: KamA family radical SAM protein [Deltaproteobacteria bacterium]|nr:KamA family radical SAM protein [Deltaproteobacteria bacterium]
MGKEQESSFLNTSLTQKNGKGAEIAPRFFYGVDALAKLFALSGAQLKIFKEVDRYFPVRIPGFYLSLMSSDDPFCPIKRQALPSLEELSGSGHEDPLAENDNSLTPSFIKKYPGRGVFLISSECAMFCRFCNRKRVLGRNVDFESSWDETFECMEKMEDLREVIISGGDPLMQSIDKLYYVLERIRRIRRVRTLRISTRVPVVFPQGISEEFLKILTKFNPLWIVIHINHPREITESFKRIIREIQKKGSPVISQTVLLRGVNDCARTLIELFDGLVSLGIKPYYLFQLDEVIGAQHFKVRLSDGIRIYKTIRKHSSGLAVPNYVVDLSGGLGKVSVTESLIRKNGGVGYFRTDDGKIGKYGDDGYESECKRCGLCVHTEE